MARMAFIHLRTHTEYSVVDGTLRVDDAAALARGDQQPALAITDLSNLFGAVKFYKACRGKGVKPILGADVWVEPLPDAGDRTQATRLLLLVQNKQGYLNLSELLARAWTQHVQRAQAWVAWDDLRELQDGLICLSGFEHGAVGQALGATMPEGAIVVDESVTTGRGFFPFSAGAPTRSCGAGPTGCHSWLRRTGRHSRPRCAQRSVRGPPRWTSYPSSCTPSSSRPRC